MKTGKRLSIFSLLFLFITVIFLACGGGGGGGSLHPNTDPAVTISSPSDGSMYNSGDTITFSGIGLDAEDGPLIGASLVWTSNIDGQIGTGESFTRNDLSVGTHTITLTATDSNNATGSDEITIDIGIDDNYEPNNDMASAYDLSSDEQTWLSTIDGLGVQADEDWYQIDVTSGYERVVVDLQFTHADGDIDLALVDTSSTILAISESTTDDESIDFTVSASGTYYIVVYFDDAGNTYDLWWDDISVSDDNYEPNNIMSHAYNLSSNAQTWLSTIDGLGVQSDADWYQIYVTLGYELVNVDLQFTHADGDIDLALVDTSGTILAISENTTDDESIDFTVSASGTYYIVVYYSNAGNTYDLWWDDISPPRFTDMNDGTIRDNETGLIWLKDASCSELFGTDSVGRADWDIAMSAVAVLADGTCGLTDGSLAGDWRAPNRSEYSGLMNDSYTNPALENTAGDGQWSEGDAFVGVISTSYWTREEYPPDQAYVVHLQDATTNWIRTKTDETYVWPVRDDN